MGRISRVRSVESHRHTAGLFGPLLCCTETQEHLARHYRTWACQWSPGVGGRRFGDIGLRVHRPVTRVGKRLFRADEFV